MQQLNTQRRILCFEQFERRHLLAALSDDFDDNSTDTAIRQSVTLGTGVTVAETNQRLEISIAATAQDDAAKATFLAGYQSVCQLRGNFDVQVDFQLLAFPFANGVRVGLIAE